MDFGLHADQQMLADSLKRFLSDQYPLALRHAAGATVDGFDRKVWQELVALGTTAALFTEAEGGLAGSGTDVMLVFEALGGALSLEPVWNAWVVGRIWAELVRAGRVAAAQTQLDAVIAGDVIPALAVHEPVGRYDWRHVETRATRLGDGAWRLSGRKSMVVLGAAADYVLLSARISGATRQDEGMGLFYLPQNTPGMRWLALERIDGGRVADLILNELDLPPEALLVAGGDGDPRGELSAATCVQAAIDAGVLALSAQALGAMEVVRRESIAYLQTRQQFGRPIGRFQALQHRLVDVLIDCEQARSAVINAVAAWDRARNASGRGGAADTEAQRSLALALAAAKYLTAKVGTRLAEEAIQWHGGMGMTWELPLAHYAKHLVMLSHCLGDEDFHLARFQALSSMAHSQ